MDLADDLAGNTDLAGDIDVAGDTDLDLADLLAGLLTDLLAGLLTDLLAGLLIDLLAGLWILEDGLATLAGEVGGWVTSSSPSIAVKADFFATVFFTFFGPIV